VACVVGPTEDPVGYGRAWQHSHVLVVDAAGAVLSELGNGVERRLAAVDPAGVAAEVAGVVRTEEAPSSLT
jgi:hypothetical protein